MDKTSFISRIKTSPSSISFDETMTYIDANYRFKACAFKVGEQENASGENLGSCKILAFAQLHQLTPEQTLNLFGDYYRIDVLANPNANDHQNIRNFAGVGWGGVSFEQVPLEEI